MAKRKVAYRKKNQNKLSMFLVTVVVLMIMLVVAIGRVELQQKLDEAQAQEEALLEQIAEEDKRAEEIEEYRVYTQTKKFVEEVAKEKLGLVYAGEIVFIENN